MDGHSLPHVRSLSPPHLTLQMGVSGQATLRTPEDGTVTSTVYRLAHQTSDSAHQTCMSVYIHQTTCMYQTSVLIHQSDIRHVYTLQVLGTVA